MIRKIILFVSLFGFALSGCITVVMEESGDSTDHPESTVLDESQESSDDDQQGPTLGLTTSSAGTDSDQWTISVNSATLAASISEYEFMLTADGDTVSSKWQSGAPSQGSPSETSEGAYFSVGSRCYQLSHSDIGADGDLRVGDRLRLKYAGDTACSDVVSDDDFSDDMSGGHELELLHAPTETSAGSISRNF